MTPYIDKSMESPWAPQSLLVLSPSPSLFLRVLSYGRLYAWFTLRRYHLLPYMYNDPLPAWSLSQLTCSYLQIFYHTIIDERKNVRSFNVESHRFYDCQLKNNPMRHEESKDVDSTDKTRPALQGVIFGHHQK